MKHRKTFLGIGWKFPPTFDKNIKSVEMISEADDIRESLFILLSTKPGERVMLPNYGCDMKAMVFESVNESNINFMKNLIENAVLFYEPRITLEDVEFRFEDQLNGKLLIELIYTIRKTNTRTNMVYPYYILEGTDLNT